MAMRNVRENFTWTYEQWLGELINWIEVNDVELIKCGNYECKKNGKLVIACTNSLISKFSLILIILHYLSPSPYYKLDKILCSRWYDAVFVCKRNLIGKQLFKVRLNTIPLI